ncbi:MAG: hypothetical protein NC191_05985 [Muribaculaceae bacterium]|nr:hypothetical protein [Muribaculaceae bacterium]
MFNLTDDTRENYHGLKIAFTLAEILITIGIIGIVGALTIPGLIVRIQNRGYTERLKKTYSLISETTKLVIEDFGGEPDSWAYASYVDSDSQDAANKNIIYAYKNHLKLAQDYSTGGYNDFNYNVVNRKKITYKYLNGEDTRSSFYSAGNGVFALARVVQLIDGTILGFVFAQNKAGGVCWDLIQKKIRFVFLVDVNGLSKPNQIGRDIFWFAMYDDGKLLPYNIDDTSDCSKEGKGYSCAARVIKEGKMNY